MQSRPVVKFLRPLRPTRVLAWFAVWTWLGYMLTGFIAGLEPPVEWWGYLVMDGVLAVLFILATWGLVDAHLFCGAACRRNREAR